jgi:hypothetical protein
MLDLDSAIRMVYPRVNETADDVVADNDLTNEYVRQVSAITGQQESANKVKKRLILLRKRGSDKGGLPRLRKAK